LRALPLTSNWFKDPAFTKALVAAASAAEKDEKMAYRFPEDLETAPKPLMELHKKWAFQSVVLSPMQLQGRDFGFLTLFSRKRNRRWASEDTSSLRALANTFLTGELSMRAAELLPEIPSDKMTAAKNNPNGL
jgi:hypothetical protein